MIRISLVLSLLLLWFQLLEAQEHTTYPSTYQPVPIIELETPTISVFNAFRINSKGYEFSPTYYQDGIVYVSAQQTEKVKVKKKNTPFFELFYAAISTDGMPSEPMPFSSQVNTRTHEGQATFNEAEDLIYYTGNSDFKNANGQYSMKIYEARKSEKDWEHIVDLPFNSEAYSNRHPSISPDGLQLYFASDMPGGYGGTDIYVVEKEGAYWGIPRNLGEQINTPENDAFPFIYKNEYLFFASKGHGGLGDYDIFAVDIAGGLPGPILHFPRPINSPKADIGFIVNEASNHGFFSSNRENGSGKDDIYLFEAPTGLLSNLTSKPPKSAIVESINSTSASEPIVDKPTTTKPLNTLASTSREVEGSTSGTITASEERLLAKLAATTIASPTSPETRPTKKKENTEPKSSQATSHPNHTVSTITKPRPTKKKVHTESKPPQAVNSPNPVVSTPTITKPTPTKKKVHTESKPPQAVNSPNPVVSTPTIAKPTPASCTQLSGILIKEHDGQVLANASISIRSSCGGMPLELSTNNSGLFEACLPYQCQYIIAATKAGYETNDLFFTLNKEKTLRKSLSLRTSQNAPPAIPTAQQGEHLSLGSILKLRPIYYDLQNGRVRAADAIELDVIAQLLHQYPSISIELSEHTDARGSDYYNQQLSETRAKIAKEYLVQRQGIAAARITAIGMGEKQLRNHCRDDISCTDEEHQYNRRTEIRIVKMAEKGKIWFGR